MNVGGHIVLRVRVAGVVRRKGFLRKLLEGRPLAHQFIMRQEDANKVEKREEPGNETLKLRVKFLQGRVEHQEKKAGTTGLYKEIENLRKKEAGQEKERAKVKAANMDHNMAVLAEVLERLDGLAEMMVNKCGDLTLVENLQKAVIIMF